MNPQYRGETLKAIADWCPLRHSQERIGLYLRFTASLARFLERHYVLFNLVSNPLIDLGILFELLLCYLFFYTPLARIYYFAPVPWHVYLFAFHGTVLLIAFEEVKKYYRRKGYSLEILG